MRSQMPRTTTAAESLWLEGECHQSRPRLTGQVDVDVVVIGGGITGITTALLLGRDGARVAVLEGTQIAGGVTGSTTAKVSALQATVYSKIRSRHGEERAAAYAEASLAGVERVAALAAEERLDCDLARRSAFTYAADASELGTIEDEANAARSAGLAVELTESVDLPYPVAGAVRLDDQLEFHPLRYVRGLADALDRQGSLVFEESRVLGVDAGRPCRVRTAGGVVSAERVVVATHYPVLDRGLFFALLEPARSYAIAARVRGELPHGLSISAGAPTRSVRSHRDLLIVGGEGHTTGAADASPERYETLERFARRHWDVDAVTHRWSAQDPVPYDHLPLVGAYTPGSSRIFVASGFMKWGLSGGTMAAMLLSDLIAGRANAWVDAFSPHRLSLRAAPKLAQLNAKVGVEFVGDRLRPAQAGSAVEVPIGEARVVRDGLGKTGVFRDDDGELHAVSLRCTHLGCLLRFNSAERSWDCPCHGSRFDVDGEVLEGPAVKPLPRRDG